MILILILGSFVFFLGVLCFLVNLVITNLSVLGALSPSSRVLNYLTQTAGLYTYEGSDEPYVSDGRPSANVWENNIISNTEIGVKITSGDNNVFTGNVFTGTETFEFKDTDGTEWTGNTIPSDSCLEGSTSFASGSDDVPSC